MENKLYQIEFEDKTIGYFLLDNNCFFGILYTNVENKYHYIYGTYFTGENMELLSEDGTCAKYDFYMPTISREGIPYEKLRGPNVISVCHFNIAKGYEESRVCDISKYVLKTFSEYLKTNDALLSKLNFYFAGNIGFIPILKKEISDGEEETPF